MFKKQCCTCIDQRWKIERLSTANIEIAKSLKYVRKYLADADRGCWRHGLNYGTRLHAFGDVFRLFRRTGMVS